MQPPLLALISRLPSSDEDMSSDEEISTDGEPKEPRELKYYLRAKWTSDVGLVIGINDVGNDIDQTVRVISGLLASNKEIFERCMPNATSFGEQTKVSRYGFERISTRHVEGGSKLELVSQPERTEETFDTLPLVKLPDGLEDALVVKYKEAPHEEFIDYEDLFRKALMLLHDDALAVFLEKLKDTLELCQVALGEIDAWAMQASKNVSFIEKLFDKQLDLPADIDPFKQSGECCYCKEAVLNCSTSYDCHVNKCKQVRVLISSTVPGKYETTFELTFESELDRLQKFLYYIQGSFTFLFG